MRNCLEKERERRKLSRAQLAELLGVDYVTVYRWETHRKPIAYDALTSICRLWAIPPIVIVPAFGDIPEEECVHA